MQDQWRAQVCWLLLLLAATLLSAQGAHGSMAHLRGLRSAQAAVLAYPQVTLPGAGAPVMLCVQQLSNDGTRWVTGAESAALAVARSDANDGFVSSQDFDRCEGTATRDPAAQCYNGQAVVAQQQRAWTEVWCYSKPRCWTNPDGSSACVGRRR